MVTNILKRFGCETVLVRGVEYQFYLFPGRFRYQSSQRIQYMLHAVKGGAKLNKIKSSWKVLVKIFANVRGDVCGWRHAEKRKLLNTVIK